MRLLGRVRLYWDGLYAEKLVMEVKFKLHKYWFNEKICEVLEDKRYIGDSGDYSDEDEFWESCFETVKNRDNLEEIAKSMVIKHLKTIYKETDNDNKREKLKELITAVNKNFLIEVEYNKNK